MRVYAEMFDKVKDVINIMAEDDKETEKLREK
jgi:hypothetical protein